MYNKACCFDLEYNNELKMNDKLEENECDMCDMCDMCDKYIIS